MYSLLIFTQSYSPPHLSHILNSNPPPHYVSYSILPLLFHYMHSSLPHIPIAPLTQFIGIVFLVILWPTVMQQMNSSVKVENNLNTFSHRKAQLWPWLTATDLQPWQLSRSIGMPGNNLSKACIYSTNLTEYLCNLQLRSEPYIYLTYSNISYNMIASRKIE